jgi:hypothetical protein
MKKPLIQQEAFQEFIGDMSLEDDQGWSREVWKAAWEAAFDAVDAYSKDHDREWREYALEIIDELK